MGHTKFVWQGERVDGGSEWGISAVDEIVKIAGYSSFESVHHYLHLLLHCLHLREDGGWSLIHEGWDAYVSPLQSAWGVTSFWPFAVSLLSAKVSQVFCNIIVRLSM